MRRVSTTLYSLAVSSMLALPTFGQGYYGQQAGYNQPAGNPGYYYGPTAGAFAGYGTPPNPYPTRAGQAGYGYGPASAGYGPAAYAQAPMQYGQGPAPSGYGYAQGAANFRSNRGDVAYRAAQPTPGMMPVPVPQAEMDRSAPPAEMDRNAPPAPTPPYPSVEAISPGGSSGQASASDRSGTSEKSEGGSSSGSSSDLWCDQCQSCEGTCHRCCSDLFRHESGVFADFLYLRAFDVDMAHGIQENVSQSGIGTVPAGDVGTLKPEFEPGFRVGIERACCGGCSSVRAAYTQDRKSVV